MYSQNRKMQTAISFIHLCTIYGTLCMKPLETSQFPFYTCEHISALDVRKQTIPATFSWTWLEDFFVFTARSCISRCTYLFVQLLALVKMLFFLSLNFQAQILEILFAIVDMYSFQSWICFSFFLNWNLLIRKWYGNKENFMLFPLDINKWYK